MSNSKNCSIEYKAFSGRKHISDEIFRLGEKDMLDLRALHGDGTTTAAKKGVTI
jgi:hypothetical protein